MALEGDGQYYDAIVNGAKQPPGKDYKRMPAYGAALDIRDRWAVVAYIQAAGIEDDAQGPLFRPTSPDGLKLERRHMDRKTQNLLTVIIGKALKMI